MDKREEYMNQKDLDKNEVIALMDWVKTQPHLPTITELQAILFLHCCYYEMEKAKTAIDRFFTIKTSSPDLFKDRNPLKPPIKDAINITLFTPLPKKTPENYTIILLKLLDTNPANCDYTVQMKIFDMIGMMHLHQDGLSEGHIVIFDMQGVVFGHLLRLAPINLKRFLGYVLEALPGRIKRVHFVNIVPFMDTVMTCIKPCMAKELTDMIYLHRTVDELLHFVPRECLPKDYGGSVEAIQVLHEKIKKRVYENTEFFEWEDQQRVDESKRPKKEKNGGGIFGLGFFRKL